MNYSAMDANSRRVPRILFFIFVVYALFIQHKYIEIPHMVTILGILMLGTALGYVASSQVDINVYLTTEIKSVCLFYLVTLVSGIVASPRVSLHLTSWMDSLLYFLITVTIVYIANDTAGLKSCMIFMGCFEIGVALVLLVKPVLYQETSHVENIRYSISTTLNVNSLGVSFAFGTWVILFAMTFIKKIRVIGICYIAIMFVAINKTGSRKGLLGAVVLIVLWYVLLFLHSNSESLAKKFFITIGMVLATYFVINYVFRGSLLSLRMEALVNTLKSGSGGDVSRIRMYEQAWQLFKSSPLFGTGFNGFRYYFGSYSHATYAEVLACTGIVGTVLYFRMYVISIVKIVKLMKVCKGNSHLAHANKMLKLSLVLWGELIFMATGVIHFYIIESFITFGFLFATIRIAENEVLEVFPECHAMCKGIRVTFGE